MQVAFERAFSLKRQLQWQYAIARQNYLSPYRSASGLVAASCFTVHYLYRKKATYNVICPYMALGSWHTDQKLRCDEN
eukprot:6198043-Pleurochrysis_carterae.AAC.2